MAPVAGHGIRPTGCVTRSGSSLFEVGSSLQVAFFDLEKQKTTFVSPSENTGYVTEVAFSSKSSLFSIINSIFIMNS